MVEVEAEVVVEVEIEVEVGVAEEVEGVADDAVEGGQASFAVAEQHGQEGAAVALE